MNEDLIECLCFLKVDTLNFRIIRSKNFWTSLRLICHREINNLIEVARNHGCRVEKRRRKRKPIKRKKIDEEKEKVEDNRQWRRKRKEENCFLAAWRPILSPSFFLSVLLCSLFSHRHLILFSRR